MSGELKIDRQTLLEWATQHRRDAARLREKAERLLFDAESLDRKAAFCERDAADEPK